jgi:hypothetical protein
MPRAGLPVDESRLLAVLKQDGAGVHAAWVLEQQDDDSEGGLDEGHPGGQEKVEGDAAQGDEEEEEKEESAHLRHDHHADCSHHHQQHQEQLEQPAHLGQQRPHQGQRSSSLALAEKRTESRRNREQQLAQLQQLDQQVEQQLELQLPKPAHSRKRDKRKQQQSKQQLRERKEREQQLRAEQQREAHQREAHQREQELQREQADQREQHQREQELRELELQREQQVQREHQVQREQEQPEREREQREREQREREQRERERKQREREQREREQREQEHCEQEQHDREQHDREQREQEQREQEQREQEQREQEQREQEQREHERRKQEHSEQQRREERQREQQRRDEGDRHRELCKQLLREQQLLAEELLAQQLCEQQLREQVLDVQQVREQQLHEQLLEPHAGQGNGDVAPAVVGGDSARADAAGGAKRRQSSTKSTIKSMPQQDPALRAEGSTESAPSSARRVGDEEAQHFYQAKVAFLRRRSLRLVELSNQLVLDKCTFSPELCVRSMRLAAERSMALADKAAGVGPEAARETLRAIEEQRARRLAAEQEAAAQARGEAVRATEHETHHFSSFLDRSRSHQERLARWREDRRVLQEQLELEECTFHPTLTAAGAQTGRDVYRDLHMSGLKEQAERARVRRERLEELANAELDECTFQPRVSHAPPPPPPAPEPVAAAPGYTQLFEKRHAAAGQRAKPKPRRGKSSPGVVGATRAASVARGVGGSRSSPKAPGKQRGADADADAALWSETAKLRDAKRRAESGSARGEGAARQRGSSVAATSNPSSPTTTTTTSGCGSGGGAAKVDEWHRFSNKAHVEFGDVVDSIRRLNALLARPLPAPVRPCVPSRTRSLS